MGETDHRAIGYGLCHGHERPTNDGFPMLQLVVDSFADRSTNLCARATLRDEITYLLDRKPTLRSTADDLRRMLLKLDEPPRKKDDNG